MAKESADAEGVVFRHCLLVVSVSVFRFPFSSVRKDEKNQRKEGRCDSRSTNNLRQDILLPKRIQKVQIRFISIIRPRQIIRDERRSPPSRVVRDGDGEGRRTGVLDVEVGFSPGGVEGLVVEPAVDGLHCEGGADGFWVLWVRKQRIGIGTGTERKNVEGMH